MENLINFKKELLNNLEKIKQKFEGDISQTEQQPENFNLTALKLKKTIIEKEREVALSSFDIASANELTKQLNEINRDLEILLQNQNKESAEITQETKSQMQREMMHEAFFELKNLSAAQAQEIVNTTPELKTMLGDWFSALILWMGK